MHEDTHHNMDHSAHEMMTAGHKAIEEIVQKKVAKILEEKYGDKLNSIANHIAEGVGAHLEKMGS
jgi:putative NIF3 family GTP cyclohydrolase 1 type 2